MSDKVLIVGGDRRVEAAETVFREEGFAVTRVCGAEKDLEKLLSDASVLLLPVPFSSDGVTVFQPTAQKPIPLSCVYNCFQPGKTVFCGKADQEIQRKAEEKGAALIDYMEDESLSVKNAVPTAEGAVSLALELLPVTLNGASVLILGYGRIGKLLSSYTSGIGADVTVMARKESDRAFARAYGKRAVTFDALGDEIGKADVVFNTVPAPVLGADVLRKAGKKTLFIDLASKPGGIDRKAAEELGLKAIWALSLPGKFAPVSAGKYIAETVIRLMNEKGK